MLPAIATYVLLYTARKRLNEPHGFDYKFSKASKQHVWTTNKWVEKWRQQTTKCRESQKLNAELRFRTSQMNGWIEIIWTGEAQVSSNSEPLAIGKPVSERKSQASTTCSVCHRVAKLSTLKAIFQNDKTYANRW